MEVLNPPDACTMQKIKIELGVEDEKFESQIKLFEEWLESESHLPKNVGRRLIENFIRLSECDLEMAKKMFEKYLTANAQMKFPWSTTDDKFYDAYPAHTDITILPNLTPNGYRIFMFRFIADPLDFVYKKMAVHCFTMLKYVLHKDILAGLIIVYDLKDFHVDHLGKINFKLMVDYGRFLTTCYPLRIREVHFLNTSILAKGMMRILINKIYMAPTSITVHENPIELEKFMSALLSDEHKVDTNSLNKICDNLKYVLMNDKDWHEKEKNTKHLNSDAIEKDSLYALEEYGTGGTSQNLLID